MCYRITGLKLSACLHPVSMNPSFKQVILLKKTPLTLRHAAGFTFQWIPLNEDSVIYLFVWLISGLKCSRKRAEDWSQQNVSSLSVCYWIRGTLITLNNVQQLMKEESSQYESHDCEPGRVEVAAYSAGQPELTAVIKPNSLQTRQIRFCLEDTAGRMTELSLDLRDQSQSRVWGPPLLQTHTRT